MFLRVRLEGFIIGEQSTEGEEPKQRTPTEEKKRGSSCNRCPPIADTSGVDTGDGLACVANELPSQDVGAR